MPRLVITCIRGGLSGKRFEFDGDHITIGRRQDNDLALDPASDRKASSNHAEIRRDGDRFVLTDLGSTNGTFVDGERIKDPVELSDNVDVEVGLDGPILRVRVVSESPVGDATVIAQPSFAAALDDTAEASAVQLDPPPTEPAAQIAAPSSGRTAIYRAMMVETARQSSTRLKWWIVALSVVLVGGTLGAWLYIRAQSAETERLRQELNTKLEEQTEDLAGARNRLADASGKLSDLRLKIDATDGAARERLEAQARELEAVKERYEGQLQRQEKDLAELKRTGDAAKNIAARHEKALFMLIAETRQGPVGFCTAFALDTGGLLATNAHCARNIAAMKDQGVRSVARMNRDPDRTWTISRWRTHPSYADTAFSPDVAVIKLELGDDELPVAVELATDEAVRKLATGSPIYTMGFPGRVMNEKLPAADFRAAVVSRLTTWGNEPGTAQTARVVWHSALTSKGTSGSPIFDDQGRVIAVNNGGLSARRVYTKDAVTGALKEEFAYDATGLNFGIRVDVLREILQ